MSMSSNTNVGSCCFYNSNIPLTCFSAGPPEWPAMTVQYQFKVLAYLELSHTHFYTASLNHHFPFNHQSRDPKHWHHVHADVGISVFKVQHQALDQQLGL